MITKELINSEVEKLRKELIANLEEPKFEVGKWYKRSNGAMINVQELHPRPKGYGITSSGSWAEELEMWETKAFTIATPYEVQSALEAEAVKRGFVEGAMFKCLEKGFVRPYRPYSKKDWNKGKKLSFRYYEDDNHLFCYDGLYCEELNVCSNPSIFRNGKWATIIKEKTSEEWANEYEDKHFKTTSLHNFLVINNLKITKK